MSSSYIPPMSQSSRVFNEARQFPTVPSNLEENKDASTHPCPAFEFESMRNAEFMFNVPQGSKNKNGFTTNQDYGSETFSTNFFQPKISESAAPFYPDIDLALLSSILDHTIKPELILRLDPRFDRCSVYIPLVITGPDSFASFYPNPDSIIIPMARYRDILLVYSNQRLNAETRLLSYTVKDWLSVYLSLLQERCQTYPWADVLQFHFAVHEAFLSCMRTKESWSWPRIEALYYERFLSRKPRYTVCQIRSLINAVESFTEEILNNPSTPQL